MSDVQAPQAQISTNDSASGMGLQVMMAQKQMELIDSQINKNNVEANKTKGVDTELVSVNIQNVIQDTNNKVIIGRLNSLQADYQEIKNYYEAELTEANIREVVKEGNKKGSSKKSVSMGTLKSLVGTKDYKGYSLQEIVDYYKSNGYEVK